MHRLCTLSLSLALSLAGKPLARADALEAHPDDPGRVTAIHKGIWELDLGALGILSSDHDGDTSVTRLSTDLSITVSRFIKDNVSVGVSALFAYDTSGGGDNATQLGAAVHATLHLRLGFGAFFRPGIALGALAGHHDTPLTAGTVQTASQVGGIARVQLPLAYFTSKRLVLQAGPQLDVTVGSYTPMTGAARSFTRIASGFAVGAGYVF